jgi:hypothetical protein
VHGGDQAAAGGGLGGEPARAPHLVPAPETFCEPMIGLDARAADGELGAGQPVLAVAGFEADPAWRMAVEPFV